MKEKKEKKYFLTYVAKKDNETIHGNCVISLTEGINDLETIRSIELAIADKFEVESVALIGWRKL